MKLRDILTSADHRQAPALDGATTWLNSDPLTPADLHGHVVAYDFWTYTCVNRVQTLPHPLPPADLHGHVVAYDFWTYTCVNWLRTLPYLRAWVDRYREHGLILIGV